MRTEHYSVIAHPGRGTLTRLLIRRDYCEKLETRAFIELLSPGALVVYAGAILGIML